MSEDRYLIWLTGLSGLRLAKQHALYEYFGCAELIYHASPKTLRSAGFLSEKEMLSILNSRKPDSIENYEKYLSSKQIKFVSRTNQAFPYLLTVIEKPPLGLYVLGELPDERLPKVSIVGMRRCTEYGKIVALQLGKELADQNTVVVSGMAIGIDSMALRGAVERNGYTIAVLGSGVDVCYPPQQRLLYQTIVERGCVISEYPAGSRAQPWQFPERNRLISGLSMVTVVVEATRESGAMITVNYALDQGREVLAVPGNITSRCSEGTNDLIRDGAALVTSYLDVLYALDIDTIENNLLETHHNIVDSLAPEEKLIYDCLSLEPITVDELIDKVNGTAEVVGSILTILEMQGYIKSLPAQRYIRSS